MKIKIINKSKNSLPQYATAMSSGLDVKADFALFEGSFNVGSKIGVGCSVLTVTPDGKPSKILMKPQARIKIPTGLYIALPYGFEVQVRPRSGLALKHGVTVLNSPGTIDADYRGEANTVLINTGVDAFEIEDGERMCQWVLGRVEQIEWEQVSSLDSTERGEGGFGHTGKQ